VVGASNYWPGTVQVFRATKPGGSTPTRLLSPLIAVRILIR
jgi:hypothetical protein